jgi:hypothetical protein
MCQRHGSVYLVNCYGPMRETLGCRVASEWIYGIKASFFMEKKRQNVMENKCLFYGK